MWRVLLVRCVKTDGVAQLCKASGGSANLSDAALEEDSQRRDEDGQDEDQDAEGRDDDSHGGERERERREKSRKVNNKSIN